MLKAYSSICRSGAGLWFAAVIALARRNMVNVVGLKRIDTFVRISFESEAPI